MKVRRVLSTAFHHCLSTTSSKVGCSPSGIGAARKMGLFSSSSGGATSSQSSPGAEEMTATAAVVEYRLRRALWCFFAGDALAAPTHWFYGGFRQVRQYYGRGGIVDYAQPAFELPGSIMNKSDPNGGGRSSSSVKSGSSGPGGRRTVIGDVINHGKKDLWDPSRQIHYHATLRAGENTLEAQLGRVLMRSVVESGGVFDADRFRRSYVDFMTTPGSHNDAYASTCHRMFFANFAFEDKPPHECPDNDGHNVDTVDGLVLPTIVSLAVAARSAATAATSSSASADWQSEAARRGAEGAAGTRKSPVLERAAAAWSQLVGASLLEGGGAVREAASRIAASLGLRRPRVQHESTMTACYLDSALPALLDDVVTYAHEVEEVGNSQQQQPQAGGPWRALLRNANAGGENVHRGSCLGAVLGTMTAGPLAAGDATFLGLEPRLIQGLHDRDSLEREIDAFVDAVMMKKNKDSKKTAGDAGGAAPATSRADEHNEL